MEDYFGYTLKILDILFKDTHKILFSRYSEDATFQEFKRYLKLTRYFHLIVLSLFLIFTIFLTINLFSGKLKFFGIIGIISILFCIFFIWRYFLILKFIRFKKLREDSSSNHRKLKWNKWQFKDYVFKKPLSIGENTKIAFDYHNAREGFVLYFLCQYPNGHLRWLGFNNQGLKERKITEYTDSIERLINQRIGRIMEYSFNTAPQILLKPSAILAMRIRANVKEKPIEIKEIRFYE